MPFIPGPSARGFVARAAEALGLSNKQLGKLVGVSTRTVVRWWAHQSSPSSSSIATLAVAVYPKNASLAASLAAEVGESLVSLGLERPAAPIPAPAAQVPPPPPPRPVPSVPMLVEVVVGAAADAMGTPPSATRGALLAACSAARALGLSLEDVESALRAKITPPQAAPGSSAGR